MKISNLLGAVLLTGILLLPQGARADLADVKASGVLRHLGVPYANFVTGSGDGMDVELVQLFAVHLGVKYEYVPTTWKALIGDLTGHRAKSKGSEVEWLEEVPVKGDIIANGFTVLPWREKAVDFSLPTFPTQVWLVTRADSPLTPIIPAGDLGKDIQATKAKLHGQSLTGVANTCLDPSMYKLEQEQAEIKLFNGSLNEVAPVVLKKDTEVGLLDVPDTLIALEKWPGQIKVLGPISEQQLMAAAFRKDSPELRKAFNDFLLQIKKDGTFVKLVKKYYPGVFEYYDTFFSGSK